MFHAGRELKPEHAESFQGVAPSRVEIPNRLARPGQGSDLQASDFHLPRAAPPPTRPKLRQRVGNTCPTGANPAKRYSAPSCARHLLTFSLQIHGGLSASTKIQSPCARCTLQLLSRFQNLFSPYFLLDTSQDVTLCAFRMDGLVLFLRTDCSRIPVLSKAAFLNADQCLFLILQGMDARRHDLSGALWKNRFELAGIMVLAFLPSCASCLPCLESCRVSRPAARVGVALAARKSDNQERRLPFVPEASRSPQCILASMSGMSGCSSFSGFRTCRIDSGAPFCMSWSGFRLGHADLAMTPDQRFSHVSGPVDCYQNPGLGFSPILHVLV